jgi:hypothetical protein
MSEFTEVEKQYMKRTVPCDCHCAFHKYGITEEEITSNKIQEAKRTADFLRQEAMPKTTKNIFDDANVLHSRGRGEQETVIIETKDSRGETAGPMAVRYGFVCDLEKETDKEFLKQEEEKAWLRYHTGQKTKPPPKRKQPQRFSSLK